MTRPDDRGSAALLTLAAAAAVLAAALTVLAWGAAVVARHRADRAADAAALAGAASLFGGGDGCSAAARVANLEGARLTACSALGQSVTVVVEVAVSGAATTWGPLGPARARSRAGR